MVKFNNEIKAQATLLRAQGYLYAHIAKKLNISKSTAYSWTKDIKLSPELQLRIDKQRRELRMQAVRAMTRAKQARSVARAASLTAEARSILERVHIKGNYGKVLCAALFWCEGQTSTESGVKFINSDPRMIRLFLKLLRENFEVNETRFRALVHLHDYHDEQRQLAYWSRVTGIPTQQFYKSYRKPHTGKNTREGYPGCISVRYGDAPLAQKLKMIYSVLGETI